MAQNKHEPDERVTRSMIDNGCSAFEDWFSEMALYGFFEEMPCQSFVEDFVDLFGYV